ncbi:hypothetical protein [Methylocapsa palsarum]|uniref:Uncharacterized protein n=1 Tax=Methylocapsa palsarum TaxID=1612308 RepID=A0A1I4CQG9_9HYPH|nr:hypothetical protein [Methylocapsa palsarum]SFK83508.1 hypothetical protein SAMN05444581_12721 [Methylocapsa palsarum]
MATVIRNDVADAAVAKKIYDGVFAGTLDAKKYQINNLIRTRAGDIRKDSESPEQAFTRCITEDAAGKLLFKAMKAARGPEIEGHAPQDNVPRKEPEFIGPAHARLHSLAVDHMRAHPGLTYAGSYTYLYSHKDNADLRAAVKAEHMRATMAGVAG